MNIAVAQSGGPTCAINASLLGVFRQATQSVRNRNIYIHINSAIDKTDKKDDHNNVNPDDKYAV